MTSNESNTNNYRFHIKQYFNKLNKTDKLIKLIKNETNIKLILLSQYNKLNIENFLINIAYYGSL